MKKTITILAILICTGTIAAQNITYDLRWNSSSSLYELYVERDISATTPVTTGGTAVVTVVFPTDVSGARTLAHTSESVSAFNPAGIIRSPGAAPTDDYYVFNSVGGASYIGVLNAGVEVLWMTFTPSDGNSEARLFINGSDPNSDGTGMMGINARSEFFTITTAGSIDEFDSNVLNIQVKELEDVAIYPNPASDILNISFDGEIDKIEMFDILGKQVLLTSSKKDIDVRGLKLGIYLLTVHANAKKITKKIIIKN